MIKIHAKIGDLPDDAIITKLTGEQEFTVQRKVSFQIHAYNVGHAPKAVSITQARTADADYVFMVQSRTKDVSITHKDTVVCWLCPFYESVQELIASKDLPDDQSF